MVTSPGTISERPEGSQDPVREVLEAIIKGCGQGV